VGSNPHRGHLFTPARRRSLKTIRITGHPRTEAASALSDNAQKVFARYIPGDTASVEDAVADELRRLKLAELSIPMKLLKPYRMLNAGEVAGFGEKEAEDLEKREIAEPWTEPPKVAAQAKR
jgi:hypothetical protein